MARQGEDVSTHPKQRGSSYFHIELLEHSVLFAEDLPTESYLDTGDRTKFSNGTKQSTLLPDFATRMWEAAGCAPLVVTGATLDAVRQWINGCPIARGGDRRGSYQSLALSGGRSAASSRTIMRTPAAWPAT
jgi:hypothetical protein